MRKIGLFLIFMMMVSCVPQKGIDYPVTLMTCDPGHFHAGLVQKVMYPEVNPEVYVYAPAGPDVENHMLQIEGYNARTESPTAWKTTVFTGPDFFTKLIQERPGNVVVLAGNNQKKTEYILDAVKNGLHVYSDKPMAITMEDFELLKEAFQEAENQKLLLFDIMTERFEITSVLQKKLSQIPVIFGELQTGDPEHPAVIKQSIHHFFKYVSGNKIKRPPWFFDVTQEGDGIVDVTTHLVDLIQWACFSEEVLDYQQDVAMISAQRWTTPLSLEEFSEVTQLDAFPDYLKKDVDDSGTLQVYCNGQMNYALKGIHARVQVEWKFQAPEGTGDTHYSIIRGSLADLEIRQGADENYKPELYLLPHQNDQSYLDALQLAFEELTEEYPGLSLVEAGDQFRVAIPEKYRVGHEAHFGQVTQQFLNYMKDGKLPEWEVPNMIAKYYTTTSAFELAKKQ